MVYYRQTKKQAERTRQLRRVEPAKIKLVKINFVSIRHAHESHRDKPVDTVAFLIVSEFQDEHEQKHANTYTQKRNLVEKCSAIDLCLVPQYLALHLILFMRLSVAPVKGRMCYRRLQRHLNPYVHTHTHHHMSPIE